MRGAATGVNEQGTKSLMFFFLLSHSVQLQHDEDCNTVSACSVILVFHSIIHQTLTWNTVSLTYMCENFTSVYRQGTIVTESHLKDLESALNLTSLENPHG